MKKNLLLFAFALGGIVTLSSCDKDKDEEGTMTYSNLPIEARNFVSTYLAGGEITKIGFEKDDHGMEYEVYFADRSKIGFDSNGEWDDIYVPEGINRDIIPGKILSYTDEKHPDSFIVELDKETYGMEAELNNGLDLFFDREYNFIRYDD